MIALGAIGDGGVLARNATLSAQLGRLDGLALLSMRRAVAEIRDALCSPVAHDYIFAPMIPARLVGHLPALGGAAFARVVPEGAAQATRTGDLALELAGLDWPVALGRVEQELAEILTGILRLPRDAYDPQRPLGRYGIDSLMAMELRLEIERRLGLDLASLALSEDTTPARFAVALLTRLREKDGRDG